MLSNNMQQLSLIVASLSGHPYSAYLMNLRYFGFVNEDLPPWSDAISIVASLVSFIL